MGSIDQNTFKCQVSFKIVHCFGAPYFGNKNRYSVKLFVTFILSLDSCNFNSLWMIKWWQWLRRYE